MCGSDTVREVENLAAELADGGQKFQIGDAVRYTGARLDEGGLAWYDDVTPGATGTVAGYDGFGPRVFLDESVNHQSVDGSYSSFDAELELV